ncbi:SsgA family sporulation/cell division regulator [Actinacidiphila glaucinigra]|uniref:SsgA family sporulation/cell division regulator n=1 Tax=Actinacidiphila glaucinigra TaxID=235986 RepID=UPI0033AE49B4
MSGNQPRMRTRRTASRTCTALSMDIERVLGVSARQTIRARFRFDPQSPWIVSVSFRVEGGPQVLWRIGRDLLQQGLYSMSGLGDVRIWPSHPEERETARLQLTSGDMAALFELPVAPLATWLEHTYEVVPAGHDLAGLDWVHGVDLLRSAEAHSN